MATFNSHEFIYVDSNYKKEYSDFTDNDVFSPEERKDFLEKYYRFLKKMYNLCDNSEYAVDPLYAKEVLKKVDTRCGDYTDEDEIYFDEMDASLEPFVGLYKNWRLYTSKAVVEENCVVLKDSPTAPNPSAMYYFDTDEDIKEIKFSFYIDKAFSGVINGGILPTTAGKTIDIRSGITDVIKLQFYANGECRVKVTGYDPYHPSNIPIGNFEFGVWQDIILYFDKDFYTVSLNGVLSKPLKFNSDIRPDSLFLCSGMFGVGTWKIKPDYIKFQKSVVTDFFECSNYTDCVAENIGTVALPFAVGSYENRDKKIVLQKEFDIKSSREYILHINSIDPGGRVFLDDCCIARTDGFDNFSVDITEKLSAGRHILKIEVFPRAPEVLASWHRHKDPYMGWFCENVSIRTKKSLKDLRVVTDNVSDSITATFSGNADIPCSVVCTVKKIWPEAEEEYNVCSFNVDGDFSNTVSFSADPWSVDSPNLYAVRFSAYDGDNNLISTETIETGFRTVCQKDGKILLNGKRIVLKGALTMQYLPPYKDTPVTHICAPSDQIVWQELMIKALGGNTMRMHILGYGSNDERYARYADRLGVLLIWTTRYIDSVEQLQWDDCWKAKDGYLNQIKQRINHPSIIMWEGSNEYHPNLKDIDKIYSEFVPSIKSVDTTRLICPVSHLYYAADSYALDGCQYYNCDGTTDQDGNLVCAPDSWNDDLVVRSAHTYFILLGYGTPWQNMRLQKWSEQPELLSSREKAYIVSEFSVIGRQDPSTKEAREEYFNPFSYELCDENVLGFQFADDEWQKSQAYQALAAHHNIKQLRLNDADGMLWCALMGGANDGGYLKPPIDNYGYAKMAFYTMRECFSDVYAALCDVDTKKSADFVVSPILYGQKGKSYYLSVSIADEYGACVAKKDFGKITLGGEKEKIPDWNPNISADGYYEIIFSITQVD